LEKHDYSASRVRNSTLGLGAVLLGLGERAPRIRDEENVLLGLEAVLLGLGEHTPRIRNCAPRIKRTSNRSHCSIIQELFTKCTKMTGASPL